MLALRRGPGAGGRALEVAPAPLPAAGDELHYRRLAEAVAAARRRARRRPVLFGITGGVAVGKSTTAARVRTSLVGAGATVDLLCTDAFLLPNAELDRRGLALRKGFPESFDTPALLACLRQLGAGAPAGAVTVPVYSHATYDRVPGASEALGGADVVIVEGVNVLQPGVADALDLTVYVDAEEADVRRWFLDRFTDLCDRAAGDASATFYRGLLALRPDERCAVAESAWDQINRVNLVDHIAPTQARATFVLQKAGDHSVRALHPPPAPPPA